MNPSEPARFDAAYPRPQLRRSTWTNLNGPWKFAFDASGRCRTPADITAWERTIQVPYCPESKMSGIADTGFHKDIWYSRTFGLPEAIDTPHGASVGPGRVLLHFGAVDYKARVWVNGQFMAEHEGGHTPFSVDITDVAHAQGPNTVVVHAEDDPHDLAKPRGKQDWQRDPHAIWYPRTSGIWQTVWLERVPDVYIDKLRWTPHFERWEIGFEAFVKNAPAEGFQVKVRLYKGDQLLVSDHYEVLHSEVHRRIALSDPGIDDYRNELLWSPDKPTLIRAEVQLLKDGKIVDDVRSYTAMRTVAVQRDHFMLNGQPYFLRLVLDQGYWPESLMTPPSDEALRKDVELVKAMGFNGVRKHQKIEDPRFLYWADVLGLLVWEEMPSAYRFTSTGVERISKEWAEVIARDSSHPCVVTWVPFNESWGVPDLSATAAHRHCVQALYHWTKCVDPTRPVIGNDGWESTATDIIGIHDYDDRPSRLAKRFGPHVDLSELLEGRGFAGRILTLDGHPHQGQPVMLTEFGGISYVRPEEVEAMKKAWGYVRSSSIEELERRYVELLGAVNGIEAFSGFCYTQLTDTFQEANGLLYADRTPKLPLEVIRAATRGRGYVRAMGATVGASTGLSSASRGVEGHGSKETPRPPGAMDVRPQPDGGDECGSGDRFCTPPW